MVIPNRTWYCYILKSINPLYTNRTYNGKTYDIKHRLRQHNGEITGGAKATSIIKPLEAYCVIEGFEDERQALQCEWRIKHPTGKRGRRPKKYCGVIGRLLGLKLALAAERWTGNCESLSCDIPLTITILPEFEEIMTDLPDFVTLVISDSIS
ncbi:MAG: GIY-YIG nuclease family protein [Colwellia sp.]|nr:GIY-YIG nuclease family protein [Colwellia sp.]